MQKVLGGGRVATETLIRGRVDDCRHVHRKEALAQGVQDFCGRERDVESERDKWQDQRETIVMGGGIYEAKRKRWREVCEDWAKERPDRSGD